MIGKLFAQRLIPFFTVVLLGAVFSANAQITTLTTGTGNPDFVSITSGGITTATNFITFDVVNNNPCPVAVTNVNNFHIGEQVFNRNPPPGTYTFSNNDSSYNLYVSYTNLAGVPTPIAQTNGWSFVANSGPINTGTTNGIALNVFKNIEVVVPANSKARFLIQTFDTIACAVNSTPISVSNNGIVLESGTSNVYVGVFPNGNTANVNRSIWWCNSFLKLHRFCYN